MIMPRVDVIMGGKYLASNDQWSTAVVFSVLVVPTAVWTDVAATCLSNWRKGVESVQVLGKDIDLAATSPCAKPAMAFWPPAVTEAPNITLMSVRQGAASKCGENHIIIYIINLIIHELAHVKSP